jgi:hypothetical protein
MIMDIPTSARVECVDGAAGRCTGVTIEYKIWQVTHLIVKEDSFSHSEHLISVDWVTETSPDLVRLRCNRSKLAAMQPLVETVYREFTHSEFVGGPYCGWYGWPFVALMRAVVPLKRERIPAGELAVRQFARVNATDGQVGRVDEFLADPASRQITHLVLREGHLWSQKDVVVPISEVDRAGEDVVYLKLDRNAVRSLPAFPVRRWHGRKAA